MEMFSTLADSELITLDPAGSVWLVTQLLEMFSTLDGRDDMVVAEAVRTTNWVAEVTGLEATDVVATKANWLCADPVGNVRMAVVPSFETTVIGDGAVIPELGTCVWNAKVAPSRLWPVTVMLAVVLTAAFEGWIPVMEGGAAFTVKPAAAVATSVPVVMTTLRVPWADAASMVMLALRAVVPVIVRLFTVMPAPKLTVVVPPVKWVFCPTMATSSVLPAVAEFGEMLVITGWGITLMESDADAV